MVSIGSWNQIYKSQIFAIPSKGKAHLLKSIIQLMGSDILRPKVIPLSCVHSTLKSTVHYYSHYKQENNLKGKQFIRIRIISVKTLKI
jgi:hypothetical protein